MAVQDRLHACRTRADHSTALRGPAPRHAVVDPMPASQEAVDELLASLQLPVGPAEEYLELEGHLGHRTRSANDLPSFEKNIMQADQWHWACSLSCIKSVFVSPPPPPGLPCYGGLRLKTQQ